MHVKRIANGQADGLQVVARTQAAPLAPLAWACMRPLEDRPKLLVAVEYTQRAKVAWKPVPLGRTAESAGQRVVAELARLVSPCR